MLRDGDWPSHRDRRGFRAELLEHRQVVEFPVSGDWSEAALVFACLEAEPPFGERSALKLRARERLRERERTTGQTILRAANSRAKSELSREIISSAS